MVVDSPGSVAGMQSPNGLKDSETLFKVAGGLQRDGSPLHTKTYPLRFGAFFILIEDQIDLSASLLVGRHTVTCLLKGLLLSKEKEETINTHINTTAPQIHRVE